MTFDFASSASPPLRCIATVLALLTLISAFTQIATAQTPITSEVVISGLTRPVFATAPEGDYERLFIVEQRGVDGFASRADIKILDLATRTLKPRPFLVVSGVNTGNEEGLLGLAFHPNYAANGYFFTYHTNNSGNNVLTRYQVSASDPDSAVAASALQILQFAHPGQSNHNGGWIGFGPDGYLYVALGDGGGGGDPDDNGQNPNTLLGSIIRIDVDSGTPYAIPPSNPFVSGGGAAEVFYWGLRNPWRNSFDRETGEFYIADVGQNTWEEINWRPAADSGNVNFGWNLREGLHCYSPPTNCDPLGITTDPIYEYSHATGCSVTGGYVYRGCAIPDLQGTYFFGDYCSGQVWSFRYDGSDTTEFQERTTELDVGDFGLFSFAEDAFGEIYIIFGNGTLRKIVPAAGITDCNSNYIADSCEVALGLAADTNSNFIPDDCEPSFICGDADGSGAISIGDAVYIINYIFGGGSAPDPLEAADADCSGAISIGDAVHLINFIFGGGPAPCATCP